LFKKIFGNKKIVLLLDIVFLIITILCYIHIYEVEKVKAIFENDAITFAEENQNPVFRINKIVLYSSAYAIDNSEHGKLENIDISQFTDIAVYIDNKIKVKELTEENTINQMYIDNISLKTNNLAGNLNFNYKPSEMFGKFVDLPNYEYNPNYVRGVWISNVVNIDTPRMTDVESYKEYLVKMIENVASYNIKLMIFQVRPLSDTYYKSKLNPWSRFITGTEGKNPGFDVLKFVIEEAKKHNIEVHAWMNPYRVSMKSVTDGAMTKEEYLNSLDDMNFAKRFPEDTILDGNGKIIFSQGDENYSSENSSAAVLFFLSTIGAESVSESFVIKHMTAAATNTDAKAVKRSVFHI
jgi:hypothetical protein